LKTPGLYTPGLVLGCSWCYWGLPAIKRNFKSHFEFTYTNFSLHLLFIATLAGQFTQDRVYGSGFRGAGIALLFLPVAMNIVLFTFPRPYILFLYLP